MVMMSEKIKHTFGATRPEVGEPKGDLLGNEAEPENTPETFEFDRQVFVGATLTNTQYERSEMPADFEVTAISGDPGERKINLKQVGGVAKMVLNESGLSQRLGELWVNRGL